MRFRLHSMSTVHQCSFNRIWNIILLGSVIVEAYSCALRSRPALDHSPDLLAGGDLVQKDKAHYHIAPSCAKGEFA